MSQNQSFEEFNVKTFLCTAVIGHVDHGKTTLTAALTKLASLTHPGLGNVVRDVSKIDNAPEEQNRGITIVASHVPIFLPGREVSVTDCPGHEDYLNNMLGGSRSSNFVILVVSAADGVSPQTVKHVEVTSAQGISKAFIVYNKMDTAEGKEFVSIVRDEVEELLKSYGMEELGSLEVSATEALKREDELKKLDPLLTLMGDFKLESQDENAPFKIAVEGIYNPKGQGTIVSGRVTSGQTKKGDVLDVIGLGKRFNATVTKIECFKREVPYAKPGMDVGIQMRGVTKVNVSRGMSITSSGLGFQHTVFKALCKVGEDRRTPFKAGFEPQCYFTNLGISITCKLEELTGASYAKAGDVVEIKFSLFKPVMASKGDKIIFKESKVNVAFGSISEVIR